MLWTNHDYIYTFATLFTKTASVWPFSTDFNEHSMQVTSVSTINLEIDLSYMIGHLCQTTGVSLWIWILIYQLATPKVDILQLFPKL